jgi:NAD-dependent dihydropyrimidine dehydrogenase PreA subunit
MVDVARYFINFLCDESCGKCTPCREGLKRIREILEDITGGKGNMGDMELLEGLGKMMGNASLCALGATAPNPVLSTLRYFREEYLAHIQEKRCPALVCKALFSYYIDPEKCQACQICLKNCPVQAIEGGKNQIHVINQETCTKCGTCFEICPPRFGAVKRISGRPVPPPPPPEERRAVRKKKQTEEVRG